MEYHVPQFFTGAEREDFKQQSLYKENRPNLASSIPMEFLQFNKAVYCTMLD